MAYVVESRQSRPKATVGSAYDLQTGKVAEITTRMPEFERPPRDPDGPRSHFGHFRTGPPLPDRQFSRTGGHLRDPVPRSRVHRWPVDARSLQPARTLDGSAYIATVERWEMADHPDPAGCGAWRISSAQTGSLRGALPMALCALQCRAGRTVMNCWTYFGPWSAHEVSPGCTSSLGIQRLYRPKG
jgi:hypothetical protein